jgi:hypothetical protein
VKFFLLPVSVEFLFLRVYRDVFKGWFREAIAPPPDLFKGPQYFYSDSKQNNIDFFAFLLGNYEQIKLYKN